MYSHLTLFGWNFPINAFKGFIKALLKLPWFHPNCICWWQHTRRMQREIVLKIVESRNSLKHTVSHVKCYFHLPKLLNTLAWSHHFKIRWYSTILGTGTRINHKTFDINDLLGRTNLWNWITAKSKFWPSTKLNSRNNFYY